MKKEVYHQGKKGVKFEGGFTLVEVLCALLIIGILLTVALSFTTEQWRLNKRLKDQNEAHYALMVAGRTIQDAIRSAEVVMWRDQRLSIENYEGSFRYEILDGDRDGIKDLYRIRNNGYNPIVSGLESWSCIRDEEGVWNISIMAKVGDQSLEWKGSMRQRIQD